MSQTCLFSLLLLGKLRELLEHSGLMLADLPAGVSCVSRLTSLHSYRWCECKQKKAFEGTYPQVDSSSQGIPRTAWSKNPYWSWMLCYIAVGTSYTVLWSCTLQLCNWGFKEDSGLQQRFTIHLFPINEIHYYHTQDNWQDVIVYAQFIYHYIIVAMAIYQQGGMRTYAVILYALKARRLTLSIS